MGTSAFRTSEGTVCRIRTTEVHAVLAQRLFVDQTDLPSPLLNQIKRLAAFQNPEFYKKRACDYLDGMTPGHQPRRSIPNTSPCHGAVLRNSPPCSINTAAH